MTTFAILCTGPSMSQEVANMTRSVQTVAVNNARELAPWAVALAANDSRWWLQNPDALKLPCRKFSANKLHGVERITSNMLSSATCSGVLALEVAKYLGAKRILLFGVDFKGTHYFGPYQRPLNNTTNEQREVHRKQFERWAKFNHGLPVINCTPDSDLRVFPMGDAHACMAQS